MASLPIKFTELVSLTSCGVQVSEIEPSARYNVTSDNDLTTNIC